MALLIAWVSLGTCAFLAAMLLVLWIDTRGDRRALGAARQTIATLQHRARQEAIVLCLLAGARRPAND